MNSLYIDPLYVNEIISYLVLENDIERITPYIKPTHKTIKENRTRICASEDNASFYHFNYMESFSTSTKYLENYGLTGDGIVIGVGDTGVDIFHCSFFDENY